MPHFSQNSVYNYSDGTTCLALAKNGDSILFADTPLWMGQCSVVHSPPLAGSIHITQCSRYLQAHMHTKAGIKVPTLAGRLACCP
mmetsp:Transcript_65830/g.117104  ORF Transcript_65830/g.117104 Transcript_65830/m.117104 type:complete len:85 (+) Transcript_65830:2894-3148(+)